MWLDSFLKTKVEIIEEDKELNAEQASVNFEKFQKAFNRVKKELFPLINEIQKIEEDNNKIEKLERLYILQANESAMPDTLQDINNKDIMNKINEIIDHINNLEKR